MAVKNPLVLAADGTIQQLQAGDSLPGGGGGVDFTVNKGFVSNANKGAPVRLDSSGDALAAQADVAANAKAIGLAVSTVVSGDPANIQFAGLFSASSGEWNAITGEAGGLTPGATYYLDAAAPGGMTTVAPTTAGQVVQEMGVALTDLVFLIAIKQPILL